ncbi:MAG: hypothetical protein M3R49_12115 [Chloroflexota bacterium]|nr:hypothetical protein [Chloroflexota bacterium]
MSFWTGDRWVPPHPRQPATPRRRRVRDLLATAFMVLILFAMAVAFDAASGSTPQLTMTPGEGLPSANVLIRGTGFTVRTRLEFTWDATPIGWPAVRVGQDGTFSAAVVIPAAAAGTHAVAASTPSNAARRQATVVASTMFQVREASSASTALSASPSTAPSGVVALSNSPSPSPTRASPTSTPKPTPVPTLVATPVPTVPRPTPAPPTASAKLLFGIGPEADGARNLPIVREAPVKMLSSWYRPEDLAWMTTWGPTVDQWYTAGYTLHLIVWSGGGTESRFATPYGTACGQPYPMSTRLLDDMRQLAQTFAGSGRLYVTLFTEFQTYACQNDAWNPNAEVNAYYRALKDQYRRALDVFHTVAPNARVSLGWGGWQARWDNPAIGAGRSMFKQFADVMSISDFQSFQAMQSDTNTDDIKAMTSILGAYGPVMLAHYKPDSGNQAVWEADVRSVFTDASVADLVARGLFAFSFMDERNMQASESAHELVRAAISRYGR